MQRPSSPATGFNVEPVEFYKKKKKKKLFLCHPIKIFFLPTSRTRFDSLTHLTRNYNFIFANIILKLKFPC